MEQPLQYLNMDAPENLTESCRMGGSIKRKAQMDVALESGIPSFRRPFTRSQSKRFTNNLMIPDETAQRKLIFEENALQNVSEQKPNLDLGTLTSDIKKMIFPTRIKAEEIDIMNETEVKDNETISRGPPDGSHEISSTTGFIWKTGVSSEDHLMILSPTIQSRSNSSNCKNDHPHDAGLGSMNPYTSLLETIYTKYGDITQGCNFTSDFFKERCLIAICEVVMKLQEFSANDYVNPDVLAELSSTVKDAENMKLDVKWLNDCLVKIEESMRSRDELIKRKDAEKELILQGANLQKSVKKNKLKIVKLEHEIKMLEEKQAVKQLRLEVVKALTTEVKSASFPRYLMDGLL